MKNAGKGLLKGSTFSIDGCVLGPAPAAPTKRELACERAH